MKTDFAIILLVCFASLASAQITEKPLDALMVKLECPDRVSDVVFSADGKLMAASYGWNKQGGVRIWNVADHAVVTTLKVGKGNGDNIEHVAFSPDGKLFAAANWDGDVMFWAVGSWTSHKTVLVNRGSPKSLSFSADSTKLAFSSENVALTYDLRSTQTTVLATRTDVRNSFFSISFTPDGKFAMVFRNDVVQVWDIENGKLMRKWEPPNSGFFGRVSPDGNYIITGGGAVYGRKSVEIWSTRDEKKIGELSHFRSGLFALAFSHSAKLFAVAGGNYGSGGDLSLWSIDESRELGFTSFGEFPIQGLSFSPDDSILAAASNDGFVLLYAVDRIRGPQVVKQDYALCGEILITGDRSFVVPLSKVPGSMRREFDFAWKLEIVNSDSIASLSGAPVALEDWNIESSAAGDRARINQFRRLQPRMEGSGGTSDHIVFGDIQNPGWNEGFVAKIYRDETFVAANNFGRCMAYGSLEQLKTNFESIRKGLVGEGLLAIPKEPLVIGAAHFRTRFIELAFDGVPELRSDADSFELLLKGEPSKKREAFSRIFDQEESLINTLLHAGMKR